MGFNENYSINRDNKIYIFVRQKLDSKILLPILHIFQRIFVCDKENASLCKIAENYVKQETRLTKSKWKSQRQSVSKDVLSYASQGLV